MSCDSEMEATLVLLKSRYRTLVSELEEIKGSHILNQPEMKSQDGGTTLEKAKKIKQLEESIAAAAKAIKDHLELCDTLSGNESWTIESQLEL